MSGGNQQSNSSVFMLGMILNIMAAVNYSNLLNYGLQAVLGGAILLGFKLLGEYLSRKFQKSEVSFKTLRRKAGLRKSRKYKPSQR
jgi:hypothetical protein